MNKETNEYERRINEDLNKLYNQLDIVALMKRKRIGWAGYVWRAKGKRMLNKVTSWVPDKKRPWGDRDNNSKTVYIRS